MFQPSFNRIQKEDLGKDVPKAIDPIVYQVNLLVDYLKTAFAKGISIQENLMNPFKRVQLTAGATPDLNATSFLVPLPSGYQPQGVQVVNCIDLSGAIVGSAVWAEMTPGLQNGNVAIRAIYGLTAGHTYQINFLVY